MHIINKCPEKIFCVDFCAFFHTHSQHTAQCMWQRIEVSIVYIETNPSALVVVMCFIWFIIFFSSLCFASFYVISQIERAATALCVNKETFSTWWWRPMMDDQRTAALCLSNSLPSSRSFFHSLWSPHREHISRSPQYINTNDWMIIII